MSKTFYFVFRKEEHKEHKWEGMTDLAQTD